MTNRGKILALTAYMCFLGGAAAFSGEWDTLGLGEESTGCTSDDNDCIATFDLRYGESYRSCQQAKVHSISC